MRCVAGRGVFAVVCHVVTEHLHFRPAGRITHLNGAAGRLILPVQILLRVSNLGGYFKQIRANCFSKMLSHFAVQPLAEKYATSFLLMHMHLVIQCDSVATIIAGFLILFHYNVPRKPPVTEGAEKVECKDFRAVLEMLTGIIESANPI